MTVRSVIKVEVDDGEFKAFQSLYEKYDAALKKAPAAWNNVSEQTEKVKDDLADSAKSLDGQAAAVEKIVSSQKAMSTYLATAERAWKRIETDARSVAGSVAGATLNLLKWTGAGAVLSGISTLGLDHFAGSVANQRQSAFGLGVGIGQQKSFGLNFGRYVDPDATLHSVSTGLYDKTSPQYLALLQAGISPQYLANHNAADVSAELLRRVPNIPGLQNESLRGTYLSNQPLGSILGLDSVNRIFHAGKGEMSRQQAAYGNDVNGLNVSDRTSTAFQDFVTKLDRAGSKIETVFVNGLVKLVDPIGRVTEGFEKAAESLLKSKAIKDGLDSVASGLKTFADYVGTPAFEDNVKSFVNGVNDLASGIKDLVKLVSDPVGYVKDQAQFDFHKSLPGRAWDWWTGRGIKVLNNDGSPATDGKPASGAASPFGTLGIEDKSGAAEKIRKAFAAQGIDPDTALKVARSEGLNAGLGFNSYSGDSGTSFGPFQLHYGGSGIRGMNGNGLGDQFTKETGLDARDSKTLDQQLAWTANYVKTHGWGDFHGAARSGIDKFQGIKDNQSVTIYNNTGGNSIVTAGSAAGGQ